MTDNPAGHLHSIFYGDLSICGCGNPEDAYELVKRLLALCPFYEDGRWAQLNGLIGSPGATHLVLSALDEADLIEHGGVINGAWLTAKGRYALAAMQQVSWEQVDEAGFPHGMDECTNACWAVPA